MPVNPDELLARADQSQVLLAEHRQQDISDLIDDLAVALRAALAARPQPDEPTALDMVTELHRAIYGDTWARPESPRQVWDMLLGKVRGLTEIDDDVAGPAAPEEDD